MISQQNWQAANFQFSGSVVSDSLRSHGLKHVRLPCPSPTQTQKFCQAHAHRGGDAIQPSHTLSLLFLLPSIFPRIRVFSNESVLLIRWPKHWSFSFSVSPTNERSGPISFRIDWFDLLAIQRTLKSLLQQHSSKASVLQLSVFFMVQLYIHTRLLETPEL